MRSGFGIDEFVKSIDTNLVKCSFLGAVRIQPIVEFLTCGRGKRERYSKPALLVEREVWKRQDRLVDTVRFYFYARAPGDLRVRSPSLNYLRMTQHDGAAWRLERPLVCYHDTVLHEIRDERHRCDRI